MIISNAALGMFLLVSCNQPDEALTTQTFATDTLTPEQYAVDTGSLAVFTEDTLSESPAFVPVRRPEGIYRFIVSEDDRPAIEHTIQFSGSNYKLQERYLKGRDSIVVTEGNWSPSDGYIWIYRDQVVGGRYKWNGNILEYYDPSEKNSHSMDKLPAAAQIPRLSQKKGLYFYGLGNEPFWNVQLSDSDTLTFRLADQNFATKFRLKESWQSADTSFYLAGNDTTTLKLAMLPYFCNDGMSDYTYSFKIKVDFGSRTYHGCAIVYKNR